MVFNEAINQFSAEKGRSFLGFAETVIRRGLIDYLRKESKFSKQIPYSSFLTDEEEDQNINPIEVHQAISHYENEMVTEARRSEINEFKLHLRKFGITFADLAEVSPRHYDSRNNLFRIGQIMAEDAEIMNMLFNKKMLPIKELLAKVDVSRKTLERNRKLLITIAIIFEGPYLYLTIWVYFMLQYMI